VNGQDHLAQTREGTVNPALWEALLAERVRDRHAEACWSRLVQLARRGRHGRPAEQQLVAAEREPGCPQAASLLRA
jgi:hypothetical protein